MTNDKISKKLGSTTVNITWCGAESTYIRQEKGGEKVEIKPGETLEVTLQIAEMLLKSARFLVNADKKDIEEATKASIKNAKELEKQQKAKAKAEAKAMKEKAKAKKEEVEDLEDVEEEEEEAIVDEVTEEEK